MLEFLADLACFTAGITVYHVFIGPRIFPELYRKENR